MKIFNLSFLVLEAILFSEHDLVTVAKSWYISVSLKGCYQVPFFPQHHKSLHYDVIFQGWYQRCITDNCFSGRFILYFGSLMLNKGYLENITLCLCFYIFFHLNINAISLALLCMLWNSHFYWIIIYRQRHPRSRRKFLWNRPIRWLHIRGAEFVIQSGNFLLMWMLTYFQHYVWNEAYVLSVSE